MEILDRFAGLQANALNAHFDSPFQRLALPLTHRNTRIAGKKIYDTRMIRLMETIMRAGTCRAGWRSALLHKNIVAAYELPDYTLNQLRYDMRKMKAHGLVERDGKHYSYRLTEKGSRLPPCLSFFTSEYVVRWPIVFFIIAPDKLHLINSTLEKTYLRADDSTEKLIKLLAASQSERWTLRVNA